MKNLIKVFNKRLLTFTKAQISALIGGGVDYLIMIFFTEVFHIHYTISIGIGGIIGAIVNFSINKYWTFQSKEQTYHNRTLKQLLKFAVMVINSIILKASGTYFLTSVFKVDYKITRLIVDLIVSLLINYNLQKFWVFKKKSIE
ncbi:MAG: GtrA family protein [Bacteroidales bacterium]|nr:GtrA family protein [Bacteroidales bacterium]